jgi:hypothetical protein
MAKRDPDKTGRDRIVAAIEVKLRELLRKVLAVTDFGNEDSSNAAIGSKNDDFFDLKHDVIPRQIAFIQQRLK